ncbi:spore coat protein [Firmicutes bacterium CAG:582]|jgi:hypothetical protein|nr:hypothetical protein [bacterium]CDB27815.1 spore coat protein [Firmicutes bacterium CAG:582]
MNNTENCCGTNNSIADILKVILILQQNACPESCLDSCDRPMLGGGPNCLICNTRPVMLYTCSGNGCPWSMPVSKDLTTVCSNPQVNNCSYECSNVFRVEKLDGNTATFRVLIQNPEESCCNSQPYLATNSFFTMDLSCCCVIRCLNDTYVDCV